MTQKKPIELITSIVSVLVFFAFASYVIYAVKKNSIKNEGMATYIARFNDIDGISIGSDVKLSGYKVGSVVEISIIPESYDVRITIEASKSLKFPKDTTAAVRTSGLFGGRFIALLPGAEDEYLSEGEEIIYTQSSLNLENLIGTFVNK